MPKPKSLSLKEAKSYSMLTLPAPEGKVLRPGPNMNYVVPRFSHCRQEIKQMFTLCNYCGKHFSFASELRQHWERSHLRGSVSQKFTKLHSGLYCKLCPSASRRLFKQARDLRRHLCSTRDHTIAELMGAGYDMWKFRQDAQSLSEILDFLVVKGFVVLEADFSSIKTPEEDTYQFPLPCSI